MLATLDKAVHTLTGVQLRPVLLPGKFTVIPAHTGFSGFSPTCLAALLVAVTAVPVLIYLAGRPRAATRTVPVWDGGIVEFKPRMQYSAMTFSAPTRATFDALYQLLVSLHRASDDPAGISGPVHYETQTTPIFKRYLYQPVIRAVEWFADLLRPIQSGDVNLYLFVFAAVLVAYLLGPVAGPCLHSHGQGELARSARRPGMTRPRRPDAGIHALKADGLHRLPYGRSSCFRPDWRACVRHWGAPPRDLPRQKGCHQRAAGRASHARPPAGPL